MAAAPAGAEDARFAALRAAVEHARRSPFYARHLAGAIKADRS